MTTYGIVIASMALVELCVLRRLRFDWFIDYFLNRLTNSSLFGVTPLGEDFARPRYQALAVAVGLVMVVSSVAFFVR